MAKGKSGFLETGEVYEAWHANEGRLLWLIAAEAVTSGDVMVLDSSADAQAKATTTEGDLGPVCVVAEDDPGATQSILTGAQGWFQAWGRCAVVNLMSAATRGDWLVTSTTSLKAKPIHPLAINVPPAGAFGYTLTEGSTPEAFLLGGVQSVATRDEARPHKAEKMEFEYIAANTWATVCHITDQGNMTHLWLALDPVVTPSAGSAAWAYPLTIAVDGVTEVNTIVGNFFASTLGAPRWGVDRIGCSKMDLDEGTSSYYRYVSIPFDTSLTVKVQNITNVTLTVWGQVGWHDGLGSYGDRSQKFHAVSTATGASVAEYAAYVIGAASPLKAGRIEGFMLAVDGNTNWHYLEGNIDIEIDGTKTIEYSGTEDAFLSSFYYTDVKWQTEHVGMTKQFTRFNDTPYYQSAFYRFFDIDEVPFEKSFSITWHNGESGHGSPGDINAGVWSEIWYTTES